IDKNGGFTMATFVLHRLYCLPFAFLGALACTTSAPALAESWPSAPLHIIVNNPPGGAVDVVTRLIATPLSKALRQPVVVENRGGANGNIGAEAVVRAAADGYTLLTSAGGVFAANSALYPDMTFKPNTDLQPVAGILRVSVFLTTHPS